MFPDELIQILQRYKEEIWLSHIENLNKNFKQTISLLKGLRNFLADKQYDINTSDSLDDGADPDILSFEISLLKQQILYYIKLQEATQVKYDFKTDMLEELVQPTFDKKVYSYLVADDIFNDKMPDYIKRNKYKEIKASFYQYTCTHSKYEPSIIVNANDNEYWYDLFAQTIYKQWKDSEFI